MKLTRHLLAGAVAGAVGTAAMDLVWYRRYRADGGLDPFWRWELATGVKTWDDASAPGRVGQKALRAVLRREPPEEWAWPTTNLAHWATGIGWGIQCALVAQKAPAHPWLRAAGLGPAAWLSSYIVLPLAGVYQPIWRYDARTLAKDLSAHLVYGTATNAAFAALSRDG